MRRLGVANIDTDSELSGRWIALSSEECEALIGYVPPMFDGNIKGCEWKQVEGREYVFVNGYPYKRQ